jgi:hypothetical protein
MCAHCYAELAADKTFLQRITDTFLIRDPAKAIASYYAMNPDVTVEEIGLEQLCGIYEQALAMDARPVVVDADDLEDDPEGTINANYQAIGIPFLPDSRSGEPEEQEELEIWKDGHVDAARSTGIRKNLRTYDTTVDNSDHLKAFYDRQMPYFEKMYARRIRPEKPIELVS